jgi:hypothetical protein
MALVAGARWSFAGKDAGSANSHSYWGDRGRRQRGSSVLLRHRLYFAKPS